LENKNQINLSVLIVFATLGILVLLFFIIFIVLLYQKRMLASKTELINSEKDHQKKLLDASLEIAERERQKIAVNIHDEVGLNLSILKINFSRIQGSMPKEEAVENLVATSFALIENSMEIIRGIYNDIIPRTLMSLGLGKAIKDLCRQINASEAAEVIFSDEDVIVEDKNRELQLYRLIKEVINNTLRHAKPTFIEIYIKNKENTLIVIILHNGMGVTTKQINQLAENSKGLGLKSIFTRLGLLKASIDFSIVSEEKAQVIIKCSLE
jgi:two-component system NarL family sensor kinase